MKATTTFFILSEDKKLETIISDIQFKKEDLNFFNSEDELFTALNAADKNSNRIIVKDVEALNFSLNYCIQNTIKDSAIILKYAENSGQKLILLNSDYTINSNSTLSIEDYQDGYEEAGVYLLKANCNNETSFATFAELSKNIQESGQGIPVVDYSLSPCSQQTPALFLDRDGIINVDINYLHMAEDFELFEGVIKVIKHANESNWPVFVVTNQSGVGRQRFTDKHVTDLHDYIETVFEDHGVYVTDWIHCSYHAEKAKDPKYKKHSLLRKSEPGMLLEVAKGHNVDISKSFMIGDKVSDEILLPGLKNLHMKRQYDLTDAKAPVFEKYEEILEYLKKNS